MCRDVYKRQEMEWPSALINIIGKKNAAISGDGVINGRGKVFWDKYWNMREDLSLIHI